MDKLLWELPWCINNSFSHTNSTTHIKGIHLRTAADWGNQCMAMYSGGRRTPIFNFYLTKSSKSYLRNTLLQEKVPKVPKVNMLFTQSGPEWILYCLRRFSQGSQLLHPVMFWHLHLYLFMRHFSRITLSCICWWSSKFPRQSAPSVAHRLEPSAEMIVFVGVDWISQDYRDFTVRILTLIFTSGKNFKALLFVRGIITRDIGYQVCDV